MLEIAHIHIKDVIVRTKDDGDVPELLDFASRNHLQPAVVQLFVFEFELDVFAEIPDHSRKFATNLQLLIQKI